LHLSPVFMVCPHYNPFFNFNFPLQIGRCVLCVRSICVRIANYCSV
jgi:hypothetical protein